MPNIVTASANKQFDDILERLCIKLQITPTQFTTARDNYEAVGGWLGQDDSPIAIYSPHIYPQGSLRLGTTVKPLGQEEFDLDAVCQLDIAESVDPGTVFEMIWDRMYANKRYRDMIVRKRRCIRIDYARNFHLDVVPAIPHCERGGTCILVPDLPDPELEDWKPSNPLGYAEWFEKQVVTINKFAEARIDPLKDPEPLHRKPTLKRSVQLFKRWRDIRFKATPRLLPPSIILTTLAGHLYEGERWSTDALATILTKIVKATRGRRLQLYNPVNDQELISERWEDEPDSYDAFRDAVREFQERWLDLIHSTGVPAITKELQELFGEPVVRAFREAVEQVEQARAAGRLYVTKGTRTLTEVAGPATFTVPRNTFYGD